MASNEQDPLIGIRLGDYTIQTLLGRGGMARVYKGIDENLERAAAVKVLQVLSNEPDEYEVIVARFQLEAKAIASFDHPNIVTVFQFGEHDGQLFIAMKLVEGKDNTLSRMLRRHRLRGTMLPTEQVLQIINDVSAALDYAHERNIIHRDVKPSNILIDETGRAILTDFGLALKMDSQTTRGTAFGTPRYIAPEQALASKDAVPQSDVYALGVIAFEMLTGEPPFDDESPMNIALQHITTPPPSPRSLNAELPVEAEGVILRALGKEPAERYPAAGEFATALHEAFGAKAPQVKVIVENGAQRDESAAEDPTSASETTFPLPPPDQRDILELVSKKATPARQRGQWRPFLLLLPLVVAVIVLAAIAFTPGDATLQTPTGTDPPTAPATDSPEVATLTETVPDATAAPTETPDASTPVVIVATYTFSPVPPTDVVWPGTGPSVQLIYNEGSLVLYNPNDVAATVDDIVLMRGGVTFSGTRFNGPLPARSCARVYIRSAAFQGLPGECGGEVYNQTMLSDDNERFWVSAGDGANVFQVLTAEGDVLLASCLFDSGRCYFNLP